VTTQSALSRDLRLSIYREMQRIRVVDEGIAAIYGEQEMRCPVHLSIGQEAAAAAMMALRKDDYLVSGHRSHGHYLAKGGSLKAMMAEIYGKATGCARGKGGSMHLIDLACGFLGAAPIVGSTIPIGVGAAFGSIMRGDDKITMVCLGDGACETGVFHESLNFASLKKLPVIFLCENNFYSVYSPMNVRQPAGRSLAGIARAHNIESHEGDGNDPEFIYTMVDSAVAKCRRGEGPVFFEFFTYRWREHCGPNFDNDIGYRTEDEYLTWRARCPIETYAERLLSEGVASREELGAIRTALEGDMREAVAYAKQSPFPEPDEMLRDVYSNMVTV
jgi:TPP-dependent pyruvate/acetoin dehydrogenase alpha subunit